MFYLVALCNVSMKKTHFLFLPSFFHLSPIYSLYLIIIFSLYCSLFLIFFSIVIFSLNFSFLGAWILLLILLKEIVRIYNVFFFQWKQINRIFNKTITNSKLIPFSLYCQHITQEANNNIYGK